MKPKVQLSKSAERRRQTMLGELQHQLTRTVERRNSVPKQVAVAMAILLLSIFAAWQIWPEKEVSQPVAQPEMNPDPNSLAGFRFATIEGNRDEVIDRYVVSSSEGSLSMDAISDQELLELLEAQGMNSELGIINGEKVVLPTTLTSPDHKSRN